MLSSIFLHFLSGILLKRLPIFPFIFHFFPPHFFVIFHLFSFIFIFFSFHFIITKSFYFHHYYCYSLTTLIFKLKSPTTTAISFSTTSPQINLNHNMSEAPPPKPSEEPKTFEEFLKALDDLSLNKKEAHKCQNKAGQPLGRVHLCHIKGYI